MTDDHLDDPGAELVLSEARGVEADTATDPLVQGRAPADPQDHAEGRRELGKPEKISG